MEIDFNFSGNISSINKDQFDLMINENDSPFILSLIHISEPTRPY